MTGVVQLWGASAASGVGASVAAVGTFAVLGNVFGILTAFQLLELANPSQPLLRRLLMETPGTYHHSIMVANLAERAAEVIGADPLLTRVAAYYHDVGKLANPLAFIENQAGGDNIHDELDPETSAQILKSHVAEGIELPTRPGCRSRSSRSSRSTTARRSSATSMPRLARPPPHRTGASARPRARRRPTRSTRCASATPGRSRRAARPP